MGKKSWAGNYASASSSKHGIPKDAMVTNLLRPMLIPDDKAAWSRRIGRCRVLTGYCGEQAAISADGETPRGGQGHEVPGVRLLSAFVLTRPSHFFANIIKLHELIAGFIDFSSIWVGFCEFIFKTVVVETYFA